MNTAKIFRTRFTVARMELCYQVYQIVPVPHNKKILNLSNLPTVA